MEPDVAGGGRRATWDQLPSHVKAAVEMRLGSPVATSESHPGGFTPGLASTLRTADGRAVFVKAICAALNPDAPDIYRREAAVAAALPPGVPSPRLLWSYDDGDWVMLAFEHVQGRPPVTSRPAELALVLDSVNRLARALTPSPIELPRFVVAWADDFSCWQAMARTTPTDGLDSYGSWPTENIGLLADYEIRFAEVADGSTLLHGDLRADNMLLTDDGVVVVDWPDACLGAAWIDLVLMLPSVAMHPGGPSAEHIVTTHPLTSQVPRQDIDCVVAAMAGFFVSRSLSPPPPGLPTVRAFQRAQGVASLAWLRERLASSPG
jgi:hypothetical protein